MCKASEAPVKKFRGVKNEEKVSMVTLGWSATSLDAVLRNGFEASNIAYNGASSSITEKVIKKFRKIPTLLIAAVACIVTTVLLVGVDGAGAIIARNVTAVVAGVLFSVAAHTNHRLEKEPGAKKFEDATHLYHVAIYGIRKVFATLFWDRRHPYWSHFDEIVVKVFAFASRIGPARALRAPCLLFERVNRLLSVLVGHCYVEDIDLGLGKGKGDSCYIALDKSHTLGSCFLILDTHGGGYGFGTSGMYMAAQQRWLREMKDTYGVTCAILSVDYPLAPEVVYPENLNFCIRAYDAVIKMGISPSQIILAGDSAGGTIAFNMARHAHKLREGRESQIPPIAGLVLISPWVNHSCESLSHHAHRETDFMPGPDVISSYSAAYCGSEDHDALENHEISPVHAEDLDFLPPTMVTIGLSEVFHDDLKFFSNKLRETGQSVEIYEGKNCPHIFPCLYPLFKEEATSCLQALGKFCADRFVAANTQQ